MQKNEPGVGIRTPPPKIGTLYTEGYQAKGATERVATLMGMDLTLNPMKTLLVDIRYKPYSRDPQWQEDALHKRWSHCYWQLGWSLGNINYNNDLPIHLKNPGPGITHICWHLRRGTNVILLCCCADESKCHRTLVAKLVQEEMAR